MVKKIRSVNENLTEEPKMLEELYRTILSRYLSADQLITLEDV